MEQETKTYEVSDKIFTIPNVISFVRLLLLPVYLYLMFHNQPIAAGIVFAVAALTDFLDGTIARATNSVSKLGQVLDPLVDRLAMLTGVVALTVLGKLPLWITLLVMARDVSFLVGYGYLLEHYRIRIPVIFLGKVATTFFFVGIADLILGIPLLDGLGIVSFSWLPGFNAAPAPLGIWFVYIGFVLGLITTARYVSQAYRAIKASKAAH